MCFYDSETGNADPNDEAALFTNIKSILSPEIESEMFPDGIDSVIAGLSNQGDHVVEHEQIKLVNLESVGPIYFVVFNNDKVGFLNQEGEVRVYTLDGEIVPGSHERVKSYILGGIRYQPEVIEPGQLATCIGNILAGLIIGEDGISVLDLPQ